MNKRLFGRLSIKTRITLWYAALLLIICLAVVFTLAVASEYAAMVYYGDTLRSAAVVIKDEMEVEHGQLEIDSDLGDVPNVYAALFDEAGDLVYGRKWIDAPFAEDRVSLVSGGGHSWYVYDTFVSVPGYDGVWLRLLMSSDVSLSVRASVTHGGWWLLPALAALALLGGHLITARAFAPVHRMTDVAESIARGEDLSARIPLGDAAGGDELHALGTTINGMLGRLEGAFAREAQFTADAAHELRTPINRIVTQGEFALSRDNAAQKDEAVRMMLQTAREMNGLISQLLMLARMDAGQMPREDECDLAAMAREIAEDMTPVLGERGMTLRVKTTPCVIRGNRAMLARVLINLLDNAARYGREGGEVVVTLARDGDSVSLTVKDDGPGMTPEEMERVFTRFWRADDARAASGTGIGLSIVKSAAKAHGGSVSVRSAPGEGAAFTVTLPVSNRHAAGGIDD